MSSRDSRKKVAMEKCLEPSEEQHNCYSMAWITGLTASMIELFSLPPSPNQKPPSGVWGFGS